MKGCTLGFILLLFCCTITVHAENYSDLNNQAESLRKQGRYDAALPIARRALDLAERAVGTNSDGYAICLNNLALLYHAKAQYDQAEPLFIRSLSIKEKVLGPENGSIGITLNNLAALYQDQGKYTQAESLYLRSLAIAEKARRHEHDEVARTLSNLGHLYVLLSRYSQAEPLFKRSLSIREKAYGPDHPAVADTLNNFGGMYLEQARYDQSEDLFKRAIAIYEKSSGSDFFALAFSINNMAGIYRATGRYAEAEEAFKRSLEIRERTYGPEHPNVAVSLVHLASLYNRQDKYVEAESMAKRAIAIQEKTLGPENSALVSPLRVLGTIFQYKGEYGQAEPFFKRALDIAGKRWGNEHPTVASCLNDLALSYKFQGNFEESGTLFKRSLEITKNKLGSEHPNVAEVLGNTSELLTAEGKYADSLAFKLQANAIQDKMIEQIVGASSAGSTLQYLAKLENYQHSFLALIATKLREDRNARREALALILRRKGILLETQRVMQQALIDTGDREANRVFEELTTVRNTIAKLALSDSDSKIGQQALQEELKRLIEHKNALEQKISQISIAYRNSAKMRRATVQDISVSLPAGSVLLEFAKVNFLGYSTSKGKGELQPHYLSFVLLPNQPDNITLVDHGSADSIDQLIIDLKRAFAQKGQESKASELSRKLYDALFAPLQKGIGASHKIYLSPDGLLTLLPFEVLKDSNGRFLIESFSINYLTSGRDLSGFTNDINNEEGKYILLGDPDFDLEPKSRAQIIDRLSLRPHTNAAARSVDIRGLKFERLPGTREEVNAISLLLGKEKCELFLDTHALKEILYSQRSPLALHLATHGFFLSDRSNPSKTPEPAVILENALTRSGLALAGANRIENDGSIRVQNGILTAEEVLGLPLRKTELVVLSACETGLGEVKSGEGVFGLRRAFTQIGVKSLVMSMWPVPDKETQELMVKFYENSRIKGMDRCEALRQAAISQKGIVGQRYGNENPLYWGAFVFLGQAK
jgi:CHAT domain-containing protein/Tfp pilus assembly protein PilF